MSEITAMRQLANDASRCVEDGKAKGWLSKENYDTLTASISAYRMSIVRQLRWTDARRTLNNHRKDKDS